MKTKLLASTLTLGLASSTLAFGLSAAPAQASITMWNAKNSLGWCSWAPPQVDASIWGNQGGVNLTGNSLIPDAPPAKFSSFGGGCAQGIAATADGTPGGTPIATLPDTLSWGTAAPGLGLGRSQLVLNNTNGPVNPFDGTGGTISNPVKLTAGQTFNDVNPYFSLIHRNFPITAENNEPFLTSFQLLNDLVLTPFPGSVPPGKDGSPENLGLLNFDGLFLETPNSPGPVGSSCGTTGTVGGGAATDPGFGCPDIFVLNRIGVGPGVQIDTVAQLNTLPARSFIRDGFQYNIFFQLDGLINLPAADCLLITGRTTCVGVITQENLSNDAAVRLRLEKVPEPLTILGAGTAAGFGAFFKRELNKKKKGQKDSESA